MICVIATIEVTEGARDQLIKTFAWLRPQVLAEAGCIEYMPMIDVPSGLPVQPPVRSNVVTVVEKWASLDALKAHLAMPHMAKFRAETEQLRLALTVQVFEPAL
jgi:quinol monooxygenase YgiN